jgi:hypothetical protein
MQARAETTLFANNPPFLYNKKLNKKFCFNISNHLPNRSVIKPPRRPPNIPPRANIDTANELNIRTKRLFIKEEIRFSYKINVTVDAPISVLLFRL